MKKPKYKIQLRRVNYDANEPHYKVVKLIGLESFQTETLDPAVNHRVTSIITAKQVTSLTRDANFEVTIV